MKHISFLAVILPFLTNCSDGDKPNTSNLSASSNSQMQGIHPMSQSCHMNASFCGRSFSGGLHGYTREKVVTKSDELVLSVSGSIQGIVEGGTEYKMRITSETVVEFSARIVSDDRYVTERNFITADRKLNFGKRPSTLWIGECSYKLKGVRLNDHGSFLKVFNNGVQVNNSFLEAHQMVRKVAFFALKNTAPYPSGDFVSVHTVDQMYNACLEDNQFLNKLRHANRTDFLNVNTFTVEPKGFMLRNSTGLYSKVKLPARGNTPERVLELDKSLNIPDTYRGQILYIDVIGTTCLAFQPKIGTDEYKLVMRGYGDACSHGGGCMDVEGDDIWPARHFDRWDGHCDSMR